MYLFKRYEGDVTKNGHLLLNTDSILILNHEALPVTERKESKLVWWMGPKLPNKDANARNIRDLDRQEYSGRCGEGQCHGQ